MVLSTLVNKLFESPNVESRNALSNEYQLLDFGNSEKLESFSGIRVRRETPSAIGKKFPDCSWQADLRYRLEGKSSGSWNSEMEAGWSICVEGSQFELRTTPTGQIGIFPEQIPNWQWIARHREKIEGTKAINLFAYTGGTTMALARQGVKVTHIDAAKSVVNWARGNANSSGLGDAPIRWIVEDAMRFVERENKRGNRYQIVVADPPSFGRGPAGETFKIQRDWDRLMDGLFDLIDEPAMVLLSCHTAEFDSNLLVESVHSRISLDGDSEAFELFLTTSHGKKLPSGFCFRWVKAA